MANHNTILASAVLLAMPFMAASKAATNDQEKRQVLAVLQSVADEWDRTQVISTSHFEAALTIVDNTPSYLFQGPEAVQNWVFDRVALVDGHIRTYWAAREATSLPNSTDFRDARPRISPEVYTGHSSTGGICARIGADASDLYCCSAGDHPRASRLSPRSTVCGACLPIVAGVGLILLVRK
jgi:hypothetical protein